MSILGESLKQLVSNYSGTGFGPSLGFGRDLAHALNWDADGKQLKILTDSTLPCEIVRGSIDHQPATLFFGYQTAAADRLLNLAGLFAYHNAVEWCVLTNFIETRIFNSHWLKNKNWFTLRTIAWNDLPNSEEVFEGFTPAGIIDGKIEKIAATRHWEPDESLVPVDEALFEVLDKWRSEALRHAESIDGADEKIHILFVQLFILRAVEDRQLLPSLRPTLESVQNLNGSKLRSALVRIFSGASKYIQKDLFDNPIPNDIPDRILEGVIRDLYHPNLPFQQARYNFKWLETDILGKAYERYVSSVLVAARLRNPQLALWEQPVRDVEKVSHRKSYGVYYTPTFVVNFLVEKCLDHFFSSPSESQPRLPKIADFSCGSGSFLTCAVDRAISRLRTFNRKTNWGRKLIEERCIVGVDIDRRGVSIARLSLWLRLTEEPDPLPLPRLEETIVAGNALENSIWERLPKEYDIILGNPPFIASGRLPNREDLSARFVTAQGRFDFSYLFVELALKKLASQGLLGLVIPNRLFRNRDADIIRELLTIHSTLLSIVDFGSTEVFVGTSAYIGLMVARKNGSDHNGRVRFIGIQEIPSRFPGTYLKTLDHEAANTSAARATAFYSRAPTGGKPWIFLSPTAEKTMARLEDNAESLSSIAAVYQGIKTGANDIFVLSIISEPDGGIVQVENGLSQRWLVEKDCLRPVVFGSEIRRYRIVLPTRFLLFPYHESSVLEESDLSNQFPHTYHYLTQYKDMLAARESIRVGGKKWYELVRARDEKWLQSRKLLMRDLASLPSFAIDEHGGIYLIGGTAVVPADTANSEILLGFLNSRISAWYLEKVTPPFRAQFRKFEVQHLEHVPIPLILLREGNFRTDLEDLVRSLLQTAPDNEATAKLIEKEIDLYLAGIFNVEPAELGL